MSAIGWAVGLGVGLLAVAAVTSGGSSGAAGATTTTKPRFEIKSNLIATAAALPLSAFSPGDVLSVVLLDNVKKIEVPAVVTVQTVGKDGLQTVFKNVTGSADLPIDGFQFVVYPRDVLLRVPVIGGGALINHTMDATDVAMGPNVFATTFGFGGSGDAVKEMILANPPVGSTGFTDKPATVVDDGGKPGFYTTSGATGTVTNGIISPWAVGVNVNVKRIPVIKLPIIVAGEKSPGYGERGFGGGGYGGASVGYDRMTRQGFGVPDVVAVVPVPVIAFDGTCAKLRSYPDAGYNGLPEPLRSNVIKAMQIAYCIPIAVMTPVTLARPRPYPGMNTAPGYRPVPADLVFGEVLFTQNGTDRLINQLNSCGQTMAAQQVYDAYVKKIYPAGLVPSPCRVPDPVIESLTAGSVKYQPSAYTWGRRPVRAF